MLCNTHTNSTNSKGIIFFLFLILFLYSCSDEKIFFIYHNINDCVENRFSNTEYYFFEYDENNEFYYDQKEGSVSSTYTYYPIRYDIKYTINPCYNSANIELGGFENLHVKQISKLTSIRLSKPYNPTFIHQDLSPPHLLENTTLSQCIDILLQLYRSQCIQYVHYDSQNNA